MSWDDEDKMVEEGGKGDGGENEEEGEDGRGNVQKILVRIMLMFFNVNVLEADSGGYNNVTGCIYLYVKQPQYNSGLLYNTMTLRGYIWMSILCVTKHDIRL